MSSKAGSPGICGRLLRSALPLLLSLAAIAAIGLHAVASQPEQPVRLSVVGHWAPLSPGHQRIRLGRDPEAEIRLVDPQSDARIHAELDAGWIWNRSATQRLAVEGLEITETPLLPGDRIVLDVPRSVPTGASLRELAAGALAAPGPGSRVVEVRVLVTSAWERWRRGELLARRTVLEQPATGRRVQLDPLQFYDLPLGQLRPGLLGFVLHVPDGSQVGLKDGQEISFEAKTPASPWRVRLALERPRRLSQDWPVLEVRDAGAPASFHFGDQALELGKWGRISWAGASLQYRDLGLRAGFQILRAEGGVLTPGRAQVQSGTVLRMGRSRYRLLLAPEEVRLDILPRGGIEAFGDWIVPGHGIKLSELLPSHYDVEIVPPPGALHVSTGAEGGIGEAEFALRASAGWGRQSLMLLRREGQALRVQALSGMPVWRRPAGAAERHMLRKRTELRSEAEARDYDRGESLGLGDRLETAGILLEIRRPDDRPFTSAVAVLVGALLGCTALIFFALHRPRPLRIGGASRTLYDLDPASTRVRAIGRQVLLPSVPVPNLIVPAGLSLTMAGMMLQLRFWLDPRLLGNPDFFLRQLGALVLGLVFFLVLALRRLPAPRRAHAAPAYRPGPAGIDIYIWLGMLFLILTNLLTALGIGSRHNGFFFRIPGIGLTIQFSAFAKVFFAIGFARMFAHGLQIARGGDGLGCGPADLSLDRALSGGTKSRRRLDLRGVLYSLRQVFFISALLVSIFGFYTVQNDLGPGLIFTLTLTVFVCFVMGQYNRGWRGWLRFAGPQGFLVAGIAGLMAGWLLLPAHLDLGEGPIQSIVAPVLEKVMERLNLWWEPWRFTRGEQVVQSLWAVSGTSETLGYFSNLHSDFAFSAAVHENGLAGGLLILAAYLVLFAAGVFAARALFQQAEDARDAGLYERSFTVVLCCLVLLVEAAIHVGACLNFSPLTGVTLPFISSGGSSILVSYALLGIACSRLSEDSNGGVP